jgi:hypothetical protein
MQFMEFNRRLATCHLDDETKLLFAHMFEVQMEMLRTLDASLNVVNALADAVKNVTDLHENTQQKIKALTKERHAEVKSVRGEEF